MSKEMYWKKFRFDLASTFFGVTAALGCTIVYDIHKDKNLYQNTLKAIRAEAKGNEEILKTTFNQHRFRDHPVFRDLGTKIVEGSLSNNVFMERAPDNAIDSLSQYLIILKQLNAHRSGLEKLYFVSHNDTAIMNSYRAKLMDTLANEVVLCESITQSVIKIINIDVKGEEIQLMK